MNERSHITRRPDGRELHSTIGGAGAHRIVLLHPLALDASFWGPVARRLASEGELIACDLAGHGRSSGEPSDVDGLAEDVAAVCDDLGVERVTLVGCSLGGSVAQAFASRWPERVEGLVLIDTTAWYGADSAQTWQGRGDLVLAKGLSALVPVQVDRWFSPAFAAARPEVVEATVGVFTATTPQSFAATCRLLGQIDLRDRLGTYVGPSVVVVGEDDAATPPAMSAALNDALANSELRVIPGARHLTPIEAPEAVADAIRAVWR